MRAFSQLGLATVFAATEALRLYALLLLCVPGGLWWPLCVIALNVLFAARHAIQTSSHSTRLRTTTAVSLSSPEAHVSTEHTAEATSSAASPPPPQQYIRLHRRDLVWLSPPWVRYLTCALAALQFVITVVLTIVWCFAKATTTTTTRTLYTQALLRTFGVYALSSTDGGEWKRLVVTLCLCAFLVVVAVPFHLVLQRIARGRGKRLVTVTSTSTTTPTAGKRASRDGATHDGFVMLLLIVAAALVPGFDSFVLLLWHVLVPCVVAVSFIVKHHKRAPGAHTTVPRRHTVPHSIGMALVMLTSGVLLLLHAAVNLPIVAYTVKARGSVYDDTTTTTTMSPSLTGLSSRWSVWWCCEDWFSALSHDSHAWRKLSQLVILLTIAMCARRRLAGLACIGKHPSLRRLFCRPHRRVSRRAEADVDTENAEPMDEDAEVVGGTPRTSSSKRHLTRHRSSNAQVVAPSRREALVAAIMRHSLTFVVVPLLLTTALLAQDAVGLVLLLAALISLVVRCQWWLSNGLPVVCLVTVVLTVTEYVAVILASHDVNHTATGTVIALQRALFLLRPDTQLLQPSASRCVWMVILHGLSADAILLACLLRSSGATVSRPHRQTESKTERLQEAYTRFTTGTCAGNVLDSFAMDFARLIEKQSSLSATTTPSSSPVCRRSDRVVSAPCLLPDLLHAANCRALAQFGATATTYTLPLPCGAHLSSLIVGTGVAGRLPSAAPFSVLPSSPASAAVVVVEATWQALWEHIACGDAVDLPALVASMDFTDSSLRIATWAQLASPVERPLTTGSQLPREEKEETSVFVADGGNEDGDEGDPCGDSVFTRSRRDINGDATALNRLLLVGSPGHGAVSLLDYIWLVDELRGYHVYNALSQASRARAVWSLLRHIGRAYAAPVLVLVLFAAAMTVQDLDVLNALYVLFFLLFICQRAWQRVVSPRVFRLCQRGVHFAFVWYILAHVLAVFTGHLIQHSYAWLLVTPNNNNDSSGSGSTNTRNTTTALYSVLSFVGVVTDRAVGQLLVYVVLLYLARFVQFRSTAADRKEDAENTTTATTTTSLAECLQQHEWAVFEVQPQWQPVRRALRIAAIGLTFTLMTVLLHHSVLVLGLGVLYCSFLLSSSAAWAVTQRHHDDTSSGSTDGQGNARCFTRVVRQLHHVVLVLLSLYCPAVLLWLALTQFPSIRDGLSKLLQGAGCDPEELGVYARDALGRGATVPTLLLPWYLLSPLTASLCVLTREQDDETKTQTKAAARGRERHDTPRAASEPNSDVVEHETASAAASSAPLMTEATHRSTQPRACDVMSDELCDCDCDCCCCFETVGVRLAQRLLTCLRCALVGVGGALARADVGPLAQWCLQLAVAGTNVSCLGLLYGVGYALDWPGPLGTAAFALVHVFFQYLYGLTMVTRMNVDGEGYGAADRRLVAKDVLDYVGFHTPLTTSARSARYMLLPMLIAVAAALRLGLAHVAAGSSMKPEDLVSAPSSPDRRTCVSPASRAPSHEPAEFLSSDDDLPCEVRSVHGSQWKSVSRYLHERAFGDVAYEALVLVVVLGVVLLMDTVVSLALLVVVVVLGCAGRVRLLTSRVFVWLLEAAFLLILLYAYAIALGLPQREGCHLPVLLQRAQHAHCSAWELYAGCRLSHGGWVLLCLAALLERLVRRHQHGMAVATLPQPVDGCRDVESLFAQYDTTVKRQRARQSVADASEDAHVAATTSPVTAPHRPTKRNKRQERILNALQHFTGQPDRVRDPRGPLQWLYTGLVQLLPASVLLFLHGVLLANMTGVVLAVLTLALLCARRRLVERWTTVWRWLSLVLLLLLAPQWAWRLPPLARTASQLAAAADDTTSASWQAVVVVVCGFGPWSTRARVLHALVLWSAVAIERRLFNEFVFAPYLLGVCHSSVSARSRRERIRVLYQARWKRREDAAQMQEKQLEDTLQYLAETRQPARHTPAMRTPLRGASGPGMLPSVVSLQHDGASKGACAKDEEEESRSIESAQAVLRSVVASTPPGRHRSSSIAFVVVEPPADAPVTRPAVASVWHSPLTASSPSSPTRHVTVDDKVRDIESITDTHEPVATSPTKSAPLWFRVSCFCRRYACKATQHLLQHSYQPELPARVSQHTFLALCVALYRYGVRHSADLCFVLLLVNYAVSGVVTDMLFSLSALLYSMVARPWAGKRYWYGLLCGLVVSTALKLVFQVVVTRFAAHRLSPTFFQVVRVVLLDIGRGSSVSAGAMRSDILLDFACVFAVLAHCHASHDLGLFARPYQGDDVSAIAHPTTTTAYAGPMPVPLQRPAALLPAFRSRSSSDASQYSARANDCDDNDDDDDVETARGSVSQSMVFMVIDSADVETVSEDDCVLDVDVDNDDAHAETITHAYREVTTLSDAMLVVDARGGQKRFSKLSCAGPLRAVWHALRDLWRQRSGRRGAGADHYTVQFWLDSIALIVFCWAFFAIRYASTSTWRNNVVSSLQRNLLPGLFVVLLFVGVVLLCLERVVYVCHNGLAKYGLHVALVLFYHIAFLVWRVDGSLPVADTRATSTVLSVSSSSPSTTSSPSPLAPALTLLLVKLASAWVSAWQLRAGYPLMRRHDPFTARTDLFHWLGHMASRYVPFLLETRLFLDWVFSATALKVQHWWLLEDIHHNVYLRFVDMSDIHWTSARRGTRFPLFVKLYQGVVGVLVILAALFFPLFFYSTFSPQTQPTLVRSWRVELALVPADASAVGAVVLYSADAGVARRTREDILRNEPLARYTSLPMLETDFLSDARTLQTVAVPALSASHWTVTEETLRHLVRSEHGATSPVKLRMHMSYLSQTQSQYTSAADDATGLDGDAVAVTVEYTLTQTAVEQLVAALTQTLDDDDVASTCAYKSSSSSGVVARGGTAPVVDLPKFLYSQWINSGSALEPVTDTPATTAMRTCHMRFFGFTCDHSLRSAFYCDEGGDDVAGSDVSAASLTQEQLLLIVRSLDATTSTGLLGYLSNFGIIALYTTMVLALSNLLRSGISGGAHEVILRQTANPEPLAVLLRHVYWVRSSASNGNNVDKALWLEQQLFLELIDLLRSPETLIEECGRRVDDYNEDGIFQPHLARIAERPFSG